MSKKTKKKSGATLNLGPSDTRLLLDVIGELYKDRVQEILKEWKDNRTLPKRFAKRLKELREESE